MNEEIKEPTISARIRLLNYEADKIENYITNLQQEIEKLTAERTHYESKYYNEAKKVDEAINELNRIIEIIQEQPSKYKKDDLWILDRLDGLLRIAGGGDNND